MITSKTALWILKIIGYLLLVAMLAFLIFRPNKQSKANTPNEAKIIEQLTEQDALMKEVSSLRFKIDSVKITVSQSENFLHDMDENFTEHFNNLKKIQNEKLTIPNATIQQQYDVITNAKYSEY